MTDDPYENVPGRHRFGSVLDAPSTVHGWPWWVIGLTGAGMLAWVFG